MKIKGSIKNADGKASGAAEYSAEKNGDTVGKRIPNIGKCILLFAKKNAVMLIAALAAAVSAVIVPPDKEYIGYFDFRTLTCLFCVLAVVCALRNIRFFYMLANKAIAVFKNARGCVVALVYITFIGSMLIANDMALLTFLPLGYIVLSSTGKEKYMPFTFIMQNIAANLGGMLTPFGNPQNLYIYSKFNIPTGEFVLIMLPSFLISIALITVLCVAVVKSEPLEVVGEKIVINRGRCAVYLALFLLSIIIVFRVIPYAVGLIVIPLVLLFMDRDALRRVDYPLLLTFVFFFIFSGNMARIEGVKLLFSALLEKSTLLVSSICCQFISNVPSAVLLSQFTDNYRELLVGVNIGGVGTLIASLASLITFREFSKHYPDKVGRYVCLFSIINFAFLAVLIGAEALILSL